MTYRRLTAEDFPAVYDAVVSTLGKIRRKSDKAWVKHIDTVSVLETLFDPDCTAYIVDDTYLIYYEVGSAWYGPATTLEEKLVLSLRPGSSFSVVTDFLEERARLHGAELIAVGTALAPSDAALARCYSRQGYKQEVITLIKEV